MKYKVFEDSSHYKNLELIRVGRWVYINLNGVCDEKEEGKTFILKGESFI